VLSPVWFSTNSQVTALIVKEAQSAAYAWGREDSSAVRTVGGTQAFSDAYVAAYGAFTTPDYGVAYMPSVGSAYDAWQASNGTTIYASIAYAETAKG
jgi:hypothetical protein